MFHKNIAFDGISKTQLQIELQEAGDLRNTPVVAYNQWHGTLQEESKAKMYGVFKHQSGVMLDQMENRSNKIMGSVLFFGVNVNQILWDLLGVASNQLYGWTG